MTISTKGAVITSCKDAFFIGQLVQNAIKKVLREDCPQSLGRLERLAALRVEVTCSPESELLRFFFNHQGNQRTLYVFFGCDGDQVERGPSAISLSLGFWGDSVRLIREILRALSMLGACYLNECDASDAGYVALTEPPLTFSDAVAADYERNTSAAFLGWARRAAVGDFHFGTLALEDVLGVRDAEALVAKMCQMSFDEQTAALEEALRTG